MLRKTAGVLGLALVLFTGVLIAGAITPAAAVTAPKVGAATLPSPLPLLPLPYDEAADAHATVAAAIARAKASQKFVLIDFGGNWCPDCRVLAGVLALRDVKPAVQRTFEVAMVDVGRFNKNLDIPAQYGVKLDGVPAVVILDPQGHFVNAGNPTALSNARAMSPQAIIDTIFDWIGSAKQQ